jgi:OOP family OmpA-OmpF porin
VFLGKQNPNPMRYVTSIFLFLVTQHFLIAQVTEKPKVEDQSVNYVQLLKVELTDQHTKVYLRFKSPNPIQQPRQFGAPANAERIWLDPETCLYKSGDGDKKFKFHKAEGIPTDPQTRVVTGGETVDFIAYFDRLDRGVEIFDFYEGRAGRGGQTWNFFGVHIKNPLKKATSPNQPEPANAPQEEVAVSGEAPKLVSLKGTVFDAKTKQPIQAAVSYIDHGDSLNLTTSQSGKYRMAMATDQTYNLEIKAKGYITAIEPLSGIEIADKAEVVKDFYLTPLAVGETFRLDNIYFETSKFGLLPESFPQLNQLVETLKQNPSLKIRVEGHTDAAGDFDKNLQLSKNRASSVKDYLVNKGIDAERIQIQGYGATRPASQGKSEQEKQKNRRVEIAIIGT